MLNIVSTHVDFYIVLKPHDQNFHDEGDLGKGFFNALQTQVNEKLYPVHRLDKLTSGLMIVARNKSAAQWFQQAFEQNQIKKLYCACSLNKPKKKQGKIVGDMVKARNGAWKLLQSKENPAVTKFFSWGDASKTESIRWFLIKPETGKTHQIRVALKSIGAPIIGDGSYGGAKSKRGYLHATALQFTYHGQLMQWCEIPDSGEYFTTMPNVVHEAIESGFDLKWPK